MARKKKNTGLGDNTTIDQNIANCPFKVDEKVLASPKITGEDEWKEYTIGTMRVMPISGLVITSYNKYGTIVMGSVNDYKKIK